MNLPRIILDQQTSFKEVMDYINQPSEDERLIRLQFVLRKHPQLKRLLDIYFGQKDHPLKKMGELLDKVERHPVGVGVLNQLNYTRFIDSIDTLYGDHVVIPNASRISQLSALFDYTLEGDEQIIRKIICLEEIEEFTTLGLSVYNRLLGI